MKKAYPETIFTLSAGRTGTTWLSEFLAVNLNCEALHEPLGVQNFGKPLDSRANVLCHRAKMKIGANASRSDRAFNQNHIEDSLQPKYYRATSIRRRV